MTYKPESYGWLQSTADRLNALEVENERIRAISKENLDKLQGYQAECLKLDAENERLTQELAIAKADVSRLHRSLLETERELAALKEAVERIANGTYEVYQDAAGVAQSALAAFKAPAGTTFTAASSGPNAQPQGVAPAAVEPDKGPWKAGLTTTDVRRVYVESDDFTHDVRLYIDGDFADDAQRLEYAKHIAERLNGDATALATARQEGYEAGRRESQAWKDAIINTLVIDHIYVKEHDTDPSKAIADLIDWETKIALDPQVSSDAQALIERGRRGEIPEVLFDGYAVYQALSETERKHTGPENVAAVLSAVVRLLRAAAQKGGTT